MIFLNFRIIFENLRRCSERKFSENLRKGSKLCFRSFCEFKIFGKSSGVFGSVRKLSENL